MLITNHPSLFVFIWLVSLCSYKVKPNALRYVAISLSCIVLLRILRLNRLKNISLCGQNSSTSNTSIRANHTGRHHIQFASPGPISPFSNFTKPQESSTSASRKKKTRNKHFLLFYSLALVIQFHTPEQCCRSVTSSHQATTLLLI